MAQATPRKRYPTELFTHLWRGMREVTFWVCGLLALYLLAALLSYSPNDPGWTYSTGPGEVSNVGGVVGAYIADILLHLFGWLAYLVPIAIAFGGWLVYHERQEKNLQAARPSRRLLLLRAVGLIMVLLSTTGLISMHGAGDAAAFDPGGILGQSIDTLLIGWFSRFGAGLMLLTLLVGGTTLLTGLSWFWVMDVIGAATLWLFDRVVAWLRPWAGWLSTATRVRYSTRSPWARPGTRPSS